MKCRANGVDLQVGGRMGSVCHGNVGVRGELQKEKKVKKKPLNLPAVSVNPGHRFNDGALAFV